MRLRRTEEEGSSSYASPSDPNNIRMYMMSMCVHVYTMFTGQSKSCKCQLFIVCRFQWRTTV
ncbi:hypothetical protein Bca101_046009 [Brassica carinata]